MLMDRNLPRREEKLEPLAIASSLVVRKKTRILAVARLIAAVSPIAAMAVTVVTVVVDTVVTISIFLFRLYYDSSTKNPFVKYNPYLFKKDASI
jgi:hypothetical protein